MHPVALSTVPGAASVVAVPVVSDAERYDADSQVRTELNHGHAPVSGAQVYSSMRDLGKNDILGGDSQAQKVQAK
jgi:hypothetical protein